MNTKYLILAAGLMAGTQTQPATHSAIDWKMIWPYLRDRAHNGCDAVHYESRKEDGKFVVEFAALADIGGDRFTAKALENGQNETKAYYKQLSTADLPKSTQEFYRCMSELENPATAVRDGEYKKCIKRAWEYRPWFTPASIDVRAKYGPKENQWQMYSEDFGRFERKSIDSSFLD